MSAVPVERNSILTWLMVCGLSVGLTAVFWPTLWSGGGLVGGDIYSYFYPQKQFYAEALRAGEIPLWNNRTGHGYPTVGESQTGVFYPFYLLYAVLDLNTAYNVIQLGHYALAFAWCWLLARRWGLATLPAVLAAIVYTYGWLPNRMCVEWAAIGAAWLPAALWCGESFLQTARRRYLVTLSLVLGLQMLPGHYHLAFITQITLVAYLALRLFWATGGVSPIILARRYQASAYCGLALMLGFGLAAVQLGPTWELKQLSQRAALGTEHDPASGYIPWWYLGQLVLPWSYYAPDVSLDGTGIGVPRTNMVEAHLYCGLIPLVLVAIGAFWRRQQADSRHRIWWLLAVLTLVYTTGVLMPVARHLPGFGFFNGVGRYGIIFNLAIGLLAAESLQRLMGPQRSWTQTGIVLALLVIATSDVRIVSRMAQYTFEVSRPPWRSLATSPLRQELAQLPGPVRLFCRGANLPNLLGVASTPVYLGIGPQAYFDPQVKMPEPLPFDTNPTPEQIDWLRQAGVTHILSFTALDLTAWPVTLLVVTPDPFLNQAWARSPSDAFFLYELNEAPGRVRWETSGPASAEITDYRANSVRITTSCPIENTLILTELRWPGWTVQIDGQPAESIENTRKFGPYRAVRVPPSQHVVTWTYRPNSVWIGGIISVTTLVLLIIGTALSNVPPFARLFRRSSWL